MIDLKLLKILSNTLNILYIEDDLEIQYEMSQYMSKFFHKVVTANDGIEGVSAFKKEHFDLIITDLSMPNMSGLEMIEKIRAQKAQQPILITSAHSESEYMINAIKLGIDGYIIKPFDYEQLNYELFKIVEKIRKYAQNEEYKRHLKHMITQKTSELNSMISFQKYNYDKTLFSMVQMIEDRDTYTAGHSERVAHYSKIIAEEMGCSKEECKRIYQAGILHDIGKIATPDVVLLNPKKLNELEYKLIQEHVEVGYKLLVNIPMFEDLADIVHAHHERYDGTGYPRGLLNKETPLLSRIMAVADTFDAMTTDRVYKGRKSVNQAIDELLSLKNIQYDPEVIEAAQVVLKNIVLDEDINQLPHTDVEKERFSYFYNDILTNLYNQSYLDVLLVRNSFDKKYTTLNIFLLKQFSQYNKTMGWHSGDKVLKKIAALLSSCADESELFRVFGDDFILLDNNNCNISDTKQSIDSLLENIIISCEVKSFDLQKNTINSASDIEKLL